MMVAVASRKGSPGATTVASLLAAHWQRGADKRLILEVDPSGGTLAARWSGAHGLTWEPGLLDLSSIRRDLDHDVLDQVSQPLDEGVAVIPSPPSPDQIGRGIERLGDRVKRLAELDGLTVFADVGRLGVLSPALSVARAAVLTLIVCRPSLEQIQGLIPAVVELKAAGCVLGLVTIGDGPYDPNEVADIAGIELLGVIAYAPKTAAVFDHDGLMAGRGFWRSAMSRGASETAASVRDRAEQLILALQGFAPPSFPGQHHGEGSHRGLDGSGRTGERNGIASEIQP